MTPTVAATPTTPTKTVNEIIRAEVRKLYEDNGGPGGGSSGCNAACYEVVVKLGAEAKIETWKADNQRSREQGKAIATGLIGPFAIGMSVAIGGTAGAVIGTVYGVGLLLTEVGFNVGSEGGLIDAGLVKNTFKLLVDPIIPGGGTVITNGVKAILMGWF